MGFTVGDLIAELEGLADEYGEETEVRFASQPSWPFEYSINQIVTQAGDTVECPRCMENEEIDEYCALCNGTGEAEDEDAEMVIYLGEGRQLGYLPGAVKDKLGWSDR